MELTLAQLREIAEIAGKRGAEEALQEAGITTEEGVADRMFLRQMRKTSNAVGARVLMTTVVAVTLGTLYALFGENLKRLFN